jgi:hypothetical protein
MYSGLFVKHFMIGLLADPTCAQGHQCIVATDTTLVGYKSVKDFVTQYLANGMDNTMNNYGVYVKQAKSACDLSVTWYNTYQ